MRSRIKLLHCFTQRPLALEIEIIINIIIREIPPLRRRYCFLLLRRRLRRRRSEIRRGLPRDGRSEGPAVVQIEVAFRSGFEGAEPVCFDGDGAPALFGGALDVDGVGVVGVEVEVAGGGVGCRGASVADFVVVAEDVSGFEVGGWVADAAGELGGGAGEGAVEVVSGEG